MKYIIPIDRSSIRRNPDSGQTQSQIPGREITETVDGVTTTTRQIVRMHFPPRPMFLYRYLETKVSCSFCHAEFLPSELQSDSRWNGDDGGEDDESDCICPKCGVWECVWIEYELLTDTEMEEICQRTQSDSMSSNPS